MMAELQEILNQAQAKLDEAKAKIESAKNHTNAKDAISAAIPLMDKLTKRFFRIHKLVNSLIVKCDEALTELDNTDTVHPVTEGLKDYIIKMKLALTDISMQEGHVLNDLQSSLDLESWVLPMID